MESHQDPRTELPSKGATKHAAHDTGFCVGQWFSFRKPDPKGLQSGRKSHIKGPCWPVKTPSSEQSTSAGDFLPACTRKIPRAAFDVFLCRGSKPLQIFLTPHYSQGSLTSYIVISAGCHIHFSPTSYSHGRCIMEALDLLAYFISASSSIPCLFCSIYSSAL